MKCSLAQEKVGKELASCVKLGAIRMRRTRRFWLEGKDFHETKRELNKLECTDLMQFVRYYTS